MKPKLLIIYLLLVITPLAIVAGLGWRLIRAEQMMVRQRFRDLLTAKLQDTATGIADLIATRERDVARILDLPDRDPATLREIARTNPLLRQLFILDAKGRLVHPVQPVSAAEQEFLTRAGQVWKDQQLFYRTGEGAADHGWYAWFHGNGLNLVYWRRDAAGNVFGAEVDRARLLADIIAQLTERGLADARITFTDSAGKIVYQWGDYVPTPTTPPPVTLALGEPLQSWRLSCYAPATGLTGSVLWTMGIGVLVLAVALTGLAAYFYRENTRELREATQRVSFVNQVSHELKTPLTNIRMYAELLEKDLPETNRHVSVIVAESQRLSRLIANVLRFARPRTLHKTTGNVDPVLRSVIEDFTPALTAKGIVVHFTGNAPQPIAFDADALEQIVGNLLSNVEKYAAGQPVTITSQQHDGATLITVTDRGPGIPAAHREDIFQPFYRLSNKLSDGVTGTGIGLTIARDLARQHGGDLTLEPCATGACFQVKLVAQASRLSPSATSPSSNTGETPVQRAS